MAKNKPAARPVETPTPLPSPGAADDIRPADGFAPAADFGKPAERPAPKAAPGLADLESAQAEIARLRAENERLKGLSGDLSGGRFTVSIKDGPTATIEASPGETPERAFFRVLGIHSCPHRPEVQKAAADAPLGLHKPDGTIKPFVAVKE